MPNTRLGETSVYIINAMPDHSWEEVDKLAGLEGIRTAREGGAFDERWTYSAGTEREMVDLKSGNGLGWILIR